MPVLANPKHELFAQELAKGKTQIEAYGNAGYSPNDGAAARLYGNVRIKDRVTELQERAAIRCEITVADLLEELEEARAIAKDIAQPSAAVSATMGKAKLLGFGVEKTLIGSDPENPLPTGFEVKFIK